MNYQILGDYVLEYTFMLGDFVHITIWRTHIDNILPFSEVVYQIYLKPRKIELLARIVRN